MRLITNILILISVIFLSNIFYIHSGLYFSDIKRCDAELLFKFDSLVQKNEVLYLGESSNFTYGINDSVKKSISELINEQDSTLKIGTISKGALHAGIYKTLIERIPDNSQIKTIIVTVNLRSFGINWIESDLETNLARAKLIYSNYPPIIKKFLLSFKVYDNSEVFKRKDRIKWHYKHDKFELANLPYQTVKEWDKVVFSQGILDSLGFKDNRATETACHYIKNYAFTLNKDNPRIKDLDDIIKTCNRKNIKLIFNLLPENLDKANLFFGSDLSGLMKKNSRYLLSRYASTVKFCDNLALLADSNFIDKAWPTEHYYYYGRKKIADNLLEKLKQLKRSN